MMIKEINTKYILVIDDDDRIRELLQQFLQKNKFHVIVSPNTKDARLKLDLIVFDLIILDVLMPEENGYEFLEKLRKKNDTPILMLTALDQTDNKIKGLKKGADDYLSKPFDPEELLLRIKNILRRVENTNKNNNLSYIVFGQYTWYFELNKLFNDQKEIKLTYKESELLSIFAKNYNETLDRYKISKLIRNNLNDRSIDVEISRLRKKIELNPKNSEWLITVRGKGWMLIAEEYKEK